MRLELIFTIDEPTLPRDMHPLFVSYLKNTLSKSSEKKYYERYFGGTQAKDYSFSVILSKPKFKGDSIVLENGQVKMLFTADDKQKTGLIFFWALISQKNRRFPLPDGNGLTLKKIDQLREQLITGNKILFKTVIGGGLAIRQHNRETNKDRYYTVEDKEFAVQAKDILGAQARKAGFEDDIASEIELNPIQCKKVVVKQFGVFVDVTVGIFEMKADSGILQYFYQAGLGGRHSQGLGMIDIISTE